MQTAAAIANTLWVGSALPALTSFRHALNHPARTQENILRRLLAANAACAFGRAHDFDRLRTYAEFARQVPAADYAAFAPWIDRIRAGEPGVLTTDPVTHLIPTGGSTGARKLIPFTAGLQAEFNRAIGPWMAGLALRHPRILGGPSYWAVSPPAFSIAPETASVPVGFADDASYLGGARSRLVRAAMVAPDGLKPGSGMDEFRWQTLLCLLRCRELRLISVWHPSFLTLLLDYLPAHWAALVEAVHRAEPARARELERADPRQPETLWPRLRVISCWAAAHAGHALPDLRRRFPNVSIQAKGLLATEAFVTIPLGENHPLAVRSHFFEFADEAGAIGQAHELEAGKTYGVIVTTGGGLWRYRLGDRVQVTGRVGQTPSLRFTGRADDVSDLCGEKLSESFVATAMQEAFRSSGTEPRFAMVVPDKSSPGWRYRLLLEGGANQETVCNRLEAALCGNPNYRLCRELGQLRPLELFQIEKSGYEIFAAHEGRRGCRLGEIKPRALSPATDWLSHFERAGSLGGVDGVDGAFTAKLRRQN